MQFHVPRPPPTINPTLCTVTCLGEEHQRNENLVFAMICAFLCHTPTGAGCKPGLRHVAPPTPVTGVRQRSRSPSAAAPYGQARAGRRDRAAWLRAALSLSAVAF